MTVSEDLAVFPPPLQLRPDMPLWPFGLESPWLYRQAAAVLTGHGRAGRLSAVADALAGWNFERHPLEPGQAALALAACRGSRRGIASSPRLRGLLARIAGRLAPPASVGDWPLLRDAADPAPGEAFLRRALVGAGPGLYWPGRAFAYALARGLPELARDVVKGVSVEPDLAPLGTRLAAEAAFAWDGPEAGLAALEAVDRELFPRFHALARADGLLRTGDAGQATAVLRDLWRRENWHPGLTLALHALIRPAPRADLDRLPGRLFVFVYSWNRAGLLAATLESLGCTRLGPARIVVLDNGGTDETAAVCRRAGEQLGADRVHCLRLPVNIGAPAARNWLAATAGLAPDDLAAYVDDDVTLPGHWLAVLCGALLADGQADVAGARIVAAAPGAARNVQTADVRLLPPDDANTVRPLVNCGPGPDFGLLSGTRPCVSVSGCCHVLRGRALTGPAPFDIRFSPSQFDDLARDLGSFLAGRRAVYVGSLAVSHHQHAGPGQVRTRAALGQLAGARRKLDGLFAHHDMAVAASRDLDTAWDELEAKWRELRDTISREGTGAD